MNVQALLSRVRNWKFDWKNKLGWELELRSYIRSCTLIMVVKGCFSQTKIFNFFLGQKIEFKNAYHILEEFSKFDRPFKSTVYWILKSFWKKLRSPPSQKSSIKIIFKPRILSSCTKIYETFMLSSYLYLLDPSKKTVFKKTLTLVISFERQN